MFKLRTKTATAKPTRAFRYVSQNFIQPFDLGFALYVGHGELAILSLQVVLECSLLAQSLFEVLVQICCLGNLKH